MVKKKVNRFSSTYPNTYRWLASRQPKPHLIYHNGKWKLFVNWWKAAWTVLNPDSSAAYISGNTIAELRFHLSRTRSHGFGKPHA